MLHWNIEAFSCSVETNSPVKRFRIRRVDRCLSRAVGNDWSSNEVLALVKVNVPHSENYISDMSFRSRINSWIELVIHMPGNKAVSQQSGVTSMPLCRTCPPFPMSKISIHVLYHRPELPHGLSCESPSESAQEASLRSISLLPSNLRATLIQRPLIPNDLPPNLLIHGIKFIIPHNQTQGY